MNSMIITLHTAFWRSIKSFWFQTTEVTVAGTTKHATNLRLKISATEQNEKSRRAFWANKALSSLKCQLASENIAVSNRSDYYTGSEEWGLLLNHDKWATLPSSPSALTVRKLRKTIQISKHLTSETCTITHNFSFLWNDRKDCSQWCSQTQTCTNAHIKKCACRERINSLR